ncbi:hypothetical protein O9G_004064 [Rozella allomycis CSF55]|uniref:Uncharacterized protein n=1 Tax=Rozella allomycis (strain CSF55) TaxID=988480 RepID=A0A075AZR9_ROZAC|nr:hypothetical protein O9G_004064 [Rozella allomycis CSF55]|eukprot:EPZ34187.1 hypothetical protein O9G_004064 [Rozella allomycis CSF55]
MDTQLYYKAKELVINRKVDPSLKPRIDESFAEFNNRVEERHKCILNNPNEINHNGIHDNEIDNTAFVVACLALKSKSIALPHSFRQLKRLYRRGLVEVTDPNAGHGPTQYGTFFLEDSSSHYEVCYASQWEPYYIVSINAPLYDERFTDQKGDKQQHALHLNAIGYKYKVLKGHYLLHLEHEKGMEWPESLVVRDASRERIDYFGDYIGELQKRFGWRVRDPKCAKSMIKFELYFQSFYFAHLVSNVQSAIDSNT